MNNLWKLDDAGSQLLAAVDQISSEVIAPLAPTIDQEGRFPKENVEALRKGGLLGLLSDPQLGGHGQGLRAAVAQTERIARECPSTAVISIMHNCATKVIETFGS